MSPPGPSWRYQMAVIQKMMDAGPLTNLRTGGGSSSGSSSTSYDYSGLDDHLKRQDAVEGLRGSKFAALYAGDIVSSTDAANRLRGLVSQLRTVAPGTDERDPHQLKRPLVTVSSQSSSSSNQSQGPEFSVGDPPEPEPLPEPQPGGVNMVLPGAKPKPKLAQA